MILEPCSNNFAQIMQSGLSLSSDGILGSLTPDLPAEGLDMSDIPPAEV